ncbi:MAG: SulP family inorganic anion transporter [Rhodothalassiaceae bacterium]
MRVRPSNYLPILDWGRRYDGGTFANDLMAAVIVTIMLIPQSLAYALLAGLPPQVGLYASILPLIAYAVFGTSRTLAVGPVAVVSLMTAAAVSRVAEPGTEAAMLAALTLAVLSGLMLVALGLLRLGFLANFLSHPVISGFITASGILIAASQLKHLMGVSASGHTLIDLLADLARAVPETNLITLAIGVAATAFLFWVRGNLKAALQRLGLPDKAAAMVSKAGPVLAVAATTALTAGLKLDAAGVRIVGDIPAGLPSLSAPALDPGLWLELAGAAALISLIGFVESISVAQTLAAKRRQRIDPDQELIGLGASNLAAGLSGGYPVTGGFARSAVNFDAGAQTPAAGAFTAVGIALATVFLTPLLYYLPQATLAATIIVAVLSLVDGRAFFQTWRYSRADAAAMGATIVTTLLVGIEAGLIAGVGLSLILLLYRTSRPHTAVVGLVPGTEHFRNILRHDVLTSDTVKTLRVDESLYFANARFLEERVLELVATTPGLTDLILMCPAVNEIDASALESLEAINHRLKESHIRFHLSEVKGPVMDRLKRTEFLDDLTGQVYLSQFDAIRQLDPGLIDRDPKRRPVAA